MTRQMRTLEELITLQDKAIEALTQANTALQLALAALQAARGEHGYVKQLPGLGLPGGIGISPPYMIPQSPFSIPFTVSNGPGIVVGGSAGVASNSSASDPMGLLPNKQEQIDKYVSMIGSLGHEFKKEFADGILKSQEGMQLSQGSTQ